MSYAKYAPPQCPANPKLLKNEVRTPVARTFGVDGVHCGSYETTGVWCHLYNTSRPGTSRQSVMVCKERP